MRPVMANMSDVIGPVTSGPSPWVPLISVALRRKPAIRRFSPIRTLEFFQLSANAIRARAGVSCLRPKGRRDFFAVDNNFTQHGHDGGWWVIGGGRSDNESANEFARANVRQSFRGPFDESVKLNLAAAISLEKLADVCSAADSKWPAASCTDQPSHHEDAAPVRAQVRPRSGPSPLAARECSSRSGPTPLAPPSGQHFGSP